MIKITVELISAISPSRNKILGIMEIANDGALNQKSGGIVADYDCSLSKWSPKLNEIYKRGRVENFPKQKLGAWDLMYCCLKNMVGYRNLEKIKYE